MTKGSDRERDLARQLAAEDYHVIRSPSSGGGTARDQPDLAFADGTQRVVLELKYTGNTTAYYDREEVAALRRFAAAFDANPALCVRWKGDTTYYVAHPDDARETPEGNYALDSDMDLDPIL